MTTRRSRVTMFRAVFRTLLGMVAILMAGGARSAYAEEAKQRLYEQVFGEAARLDPAMVAKVKAGKAGQRHLVDRDGDGANDEVWFIDTSVRHQAGRRPILVRAIDEDGDLDAYKGPDRDSDLYVVDWKADGTVDVVIDYIDTDGDNDVDEMGMYYAVKKYPYLDGKDGLLVWWGRDIGDDNLLWYDVNWTYQQRDCQFRTHFSGDEVFLQFGLTLGDTQWRSIFENPFAFYDEDDDGCAEVVIRLSGRGNLAEAVRYSFDVDDDAYGRRTHDYDFSITGIGKGRYQKDADAEPVTYPESITKPMTLRGIPTQRWVQVEHAQPFAINAPWSRTLLSWDEMNANTDGNVAREPTERWEGILNRGSENFPQVGGPPCSGLNKRNEVSLQPARPMKLYYDPTDRKLHLKGAREGWLHVDYNLDGKADASYTYVDEDGDGFLDRRRVDFGADGSVEFDWPMRGKGARELDLEWRPLSTFYKKVLAGVLTDSQYFIEAARSALDGKAEAGNSADAVAAYFLNELEGWYPRTRLGWNMRKTPAGARLYVDLYRDLLLGALRTAYKDHDAMTKIEAVYATGDYRAAADVVAKELAKKPTGVSIAFDGFAKRIEIRIDNSNGDKRVDWPVTIPVKTLIAKASDFNADNCAVVGPEKWIDWREIPHQVDEIDPTVGKELSFLVDVEAGAMTTYAVYYSPEGKRNKTFEPKTATVGDWVPPNIGWESNRAAYRSYWGQFDFFGKKTEKLVYPSIGNQSYHHEVDWGIDALLVGKASGLGGVTLYVDGLAYRVQNPAGEGTVKFVKKQLTSGPIRAAIEITASNIVPDKPSATVRLQCLSYAERQETEIRATVTGLSDDVVVAPGFIKLTREEVFGEPEEGYFGAWGFQDAVIGDIGMGLIAPPDAFEGLDELDAERRVQFRTTEGKLRYWLIGDWRRGRQYPVAPTVDNWREELELLADQLLSNVRIGIGAVETVKQGRTR